ncbi:hypothetical protein H6G36_29270 [Anabaena minutissima FACHB-250]|nr:hypothetical protein [Anabaena minutissima FACHB-250]
MSKSSLKNKVDSIRRTLKTQGFEVASPVIESKIFELYPDFEDEWSSDARTEIIKALIRDLQPNNLAITEVDTDIQPPAIQEINTDIQPPAIQEIDLDQVAQLTVPTEETAIAVTEDDKRAMALQKSQELGITLTDSEINSIADSVEICGESLDELLNELQSALTAYIDHKAKSNTQKIDTALDNVVTYAEQRFTENTQHLSHRLKGLGDKMEAVATQNKSRIKAVLSRLAIPSGN